MRAQVNIAPRWLELSCHEHARYRGAYCGDLSFVRDEDEGVWVEHRQEHRQLPERGLGKLFGHSKRQQQQMHSKQPCSLHSVCAWA